MERKIDLRNSKRLASAAPRNAFALSLMLALLLLVFALACAGSNGYILRSDEVFSVANMGGFNPPYSPADVVASVARHSPDHVPLYFVLGSAWTRLAGWTQFALRYSSVLTALLMIAFMYRYASDRFDRVTAVAAAILLSASAFLFLHIHDFRMYPLLLLLSIAHCWLYYRLESGRSQGRGAWLLFLGSAMALIYTHTFSIMLFAGLGVHHILFSRRSPQWRGIWLCWILAALTFLPYLPVLTTAVQLAAANVEVTEDAGSVPQLILAFGRLLSNGAEPLLLFALLPLAYGIATRRDRSATALLLMSLTMLAVPLALNEVVGLIPLHRMRYFLILWFPFTLLLARGLSWLPQRKWLMPLCLALWVFAGAGYYASDDLLGYIGGMKKTRRYPQLDEYALHLRDHVRHGDFLFGFSVDHFVNGVVKFDRSVADFYTHIHLGIDGAFTRKAATGAWLTEDMNRWIKRSPRLLFAYEPDDPPRALATAQHYLSTLYQACEVVVDLPHLHVQRLSMPLLPCDQRTAPIDYENGIHLVDRFAAMTPDGESLWILAGWVTPQVDDFERYNVSFQVFRGADDKVAQRDLHLNYFLPKWNSLELPLESLAPGDYRVVVIHYPRGGGPKIAGVDRQSGSRATIHDVVRFTVE